MVNILTLMPFRALNIMSIANTDKEIKVKSYKQNEAAEEKI